MRIRTTIGRLLSTSHAEIMSIVLLSQLLLPFTANQASAHDRRHVIVDTDVALDDVRAILLLLRASQFEVVGIVTSDGACSPQIGARNVQCVLSPVGRDDIPIGYGDTLGQPAPPWRPMSEALGWAGIQPARSGDSSSHALELLKRLLTSSGERVTYVCLGPMTNLASLIEADTAASELISEVWYSGTLVDQASESWNTLRDTAAARAVYRSALTVRAIELPDSELIRFDSSMFEHIADMETESARLITKLHSGERTGMLVRKGHFRACDESVVLGMIEPSLVSFRRADPLLPHFESTGFNSDSGRTLYLTTLSQGVDNMLSPRNPTVLDHFPADPSELQGDIKPFVTDIIARYGREEWNCAILTNEFHQHLGIYSIVGVKMGIRARELLRADHGSLRVVSHAGSVPPMSCLNDGLQVSTGASLGHGAIKVVEDSTRVEAEFRSGNKTLRLKLNDDVVTRIRSDIRNAIAKYGDLTPEYFAEVRRLALQYWLELDRATIFEERTE